MDFARRETGCIWQFIYKIRNFLSLICKWGTICTLFLLIHINTFGQNPSKYYVAGAYIIDMGQSTQTIANGLKPYGLVYALIQAGIPVDWAINSSKAKDGVDFTVNSKDFRGGSFIIPAEWITPVVINLINTWRAKGVVVEGAVLTSFSAPVYKTLVNWPTGLLDTQNDGLIDDYYINAEIPLSSLSYIMDANPLMLSECGGRDVYIMPHADPNNWPAGYREALISFINNGGDLWAGCHAVSVMENLPGCNFLSNGGLVPFGSHSGGTTPYTNLLSVSADPIMQFIGPLDGATSDGSEQIYVPGSSGWRATTKLGVYDPDYINTNPNPDVAYAFPNAAAVLAYGPAFGDYNKGIVVYEAGHSINKNGTDAERVAAQRAYFNFLLEAGNQNQLNVTADFPTELNSGDTYSLTATVTNGTPPYTYQWTSSCGGVFSSPTAVSTNFTGPNYTDCILKLTVKDNCGRSNFVWQQYSTIPIVLNNSIASSQIICSGQMPVNLTGTEPTGGNGTFSYSWESSTAGPLTGFTAVSTNPFSYNPGPLYQTTWYRRIVISGLYISISSSIQVTVRPSPTVEANVSQSTICAGQSVSLFSTGTGATTNTLTLSNSNKYKIEDNKPIISPITVAGAPATMSSIISISVKVNITHKKDQQVELYLIRPGGTIINAINGTYLNTIVNGESIALVADRGGDNDNFTNTVFSDMATLSILFGSAPFTGSYRPEIAFSTFTQTSNPNGVWILKAMDDTDKEEGKLLDWTITMTFFSGVTYQWSSIPTGFTSSLQNPGSVSPAITTTYTVLVTDQGNGCPASHSVMVNVNTPIVPAQTTTICSGISPNYVPINNPPSTIVPLGTTYTWTNPTLTGGMTGGTVQTIPQASVNQILTNPTNTVQTATYTVTPKSGSCAGSPFTLTVTVNPKPAIIAMSSEVCSGVAFTLTPANGVDGVVPSGTTYSWPVPAVTGGLTGGAASSGSPTSITGTLTNPTNTAKTATYTVTPSAGSCSGNPFTVTLTVNGYLSATLSGGTSPICYNTSPGTLTATGSGGTGSYTYLWYKNGVSTGITTQTYAPGNLTSTTTIYCAVTSGTCGTVNSSTTTITVNANPTITGTLAVCKGLTTQLTGSGTPASTNPWVSGSTDKATVNNLGLVTGVSAGTSVVTYTDINGCASSATITVNTPPTINTVPAQTDCKGNGVDFIASYSAVGQVNYQWLSSTDGGTNWNNISGASGTSSSSPIILSLSNIGVSGSNVNQTLYKLIITDANGCIATSNSALLTVNSITGITGITTTTLCEGESISFTASTAGVSPISFQWVKHTSIGVWSDVPGATTQTISFANITITEAGEYKVRAIFPITIPNDNNSTTCTETNDDIIRTIVVNPLATVTPGGPDNICQSAIPSAFTLSGAGVGGGATTGVWSITNGGGTLSNTNQTASPETVTYTPQANYSGPVTLTLTTNDPNGPCGAVSATRTITINPLPITSAIYHQ